MQKASHSHIKMRQAARLPWSSSCKHGLQRSQIPSVAPASKQIWNMARGFGFGPKAPVLDRPELTPGKISPMLTVPPHIGRPPYADSGEMPTYSNRPQIHDAEGVRKLRAAGKLAAEVLAYAGTLIKPGVVTDTIDKAVHEMIISRGAYPSPLNYGRFPKSVCTSVNECVCHGIPDDRALVEGDIVNVDVTVFLDGYHGDTSRMYTVGKVTAAAQKLCDVTKEALDAAIAKCGPGVPLCTIGNTIQAIADKHKYGVVKEYVGHGVGRIFHSAPNIQHQKNNSPGIMQLWQSFTIEPMLVAGSPRCDTWKDDWTVVTRDRSLCAQYEHTLLIVPGGVEVMTPWP